MAANREYVRNAISGTLRSIVPFRGDSVAVSDYATLRNAILQKFQVLASYHGHYREFCPHAIGTKRGRQHALGYQFAGHSSSGLPPGGEWRCFDIAGLSTVGIRAGQWHTGESHTRPQSCVDEIDVEVGY